MTTQSMLKQWNSERTSLLAGVVPRVGAVALGRRGTLSGIRWRGDLLVTAAECIADAERVPVVFEHGESTAEVLASDLTTDVAVLRLAASAGPLPPEVSPTALRIGEAVAMVARDPRGPSAIWGSVRHAGAAWRSRRGGEIAQRLEFDVRFDPAFEGAAVVDMQGAIVAMAVSGPYRRVIGIPAETIEQVVAKVERHGHLPRPYLGVRLQPLWLDEPARNQLGRSARAVPIVGGIDPGSPAAEAHLELGDLLLRADGQPVESVSSLAQRIAGVGPGQMIALEVLRGGKPLVVNVQLRERPRA